MKIAVFHNLPSGGALKLLCGTLDSFLKNGHQVILYSFETADDEFYFLNAPKGIVERKFPLTMSGALKWNRYRKLSQQVAKEINQSDCDVVYVEKCQFAGAPHLLQYLTKPNLLFLHEPLRFKENEKWAEGNLEMARSYEQEGFSRRPWIVEMGKIFDHRIRLREDRKSVMAAKNILANSDYSKRWIEKVYGRSSQICYPGISLHRFSFGPALEKRPWRVLSVGRMDWHKGYFFLLNVLAAIAKKDRPEWMIVCDSKDENYARKFEAKAKRMNIQLTILSRIPEKELVFAYQNARLVLCGSVHEPFGLVPIEALFCGTPIIAVDEGGFRETVIVHKSGWLLPRHPETWASKILELKKNSFSDDILHKTSEEMREKWGIDRFCSEIENVAKKLAH